MDISQANQFLNGIDYLSGKTQLEKAVENVIGNLDFMTNPMTTDLNMANYKIINLQTPSNNTDAATKLYVDQNSGGGGNTSSLAEIAQAYPSTSTISASNQTISDVQGSYNANDVLTNSIGDNKYISTTFALNNINDLNELTGNIDLTINKNSQQKIILCDVPVTEQYQLVTKQYVDDTQIQLLPINTISLQLPTSGNTDMNFNRIINVSDGIDPLDGVNKTQLDQVITDYQLADSNLQTAVDDEILARQNADITLQDNIDQVQTNIDTVQTNLNTEISNRESADTTITLAYQNADLALSTSITNLQNTKATLGSSLTGGDLYMSDLPFTAIIPGTQYHIYNVPYIDENGSDFERCQPVSCYQMQAFGYDKFYTKTYSDNIELQLQNNIDAKMDNTNTIGEISLNNLNDQNINANSFKINNLLDGVALTDAITLSQLQTVETTQNLINTDLQTQIDTKYDNTLSLQDINIANPLTTTLDLNTGQEIHVPTITNYANVKQAMNYETYTNLSKNPESLEITTTTLPTINTKITGFTIMNQTTSTDNWITFDSINQTITLKNQGTFLIIIRGKTTSATNNNILTVQLQNNTSGLEFKSGSSTIDFLGVLSNVSQSSQGQSIQILTKQGADVTLKLQCTALTGITAFQCDMIFIQIPSQYQTSQEITPVVTTQQEYINITVATSKPAVSNYFNQTHYNTVESYQNGNITYNNANGTVTLEANSIYFMSCQMSCQATAAAAQLQIAINDFTLSQPFMQTLYGASFSQARSSSINMTGANSNINSTPAGQCMTWILKPTTDITLALFNNFEVGTPLLQSLQWQIFILMPNKVLSSTTAISNLSDIVVDTNLDMLNTYKVTGSIDPTLSSDLVTLNYFNSNAVSIATLSNYYPITTRLNGILPPDGNVDMTNFTFLNLVDPTDASPQRPVTVNFLLGKSYYNSSNLPRSIENSGQTVKWLFNGTQSRLKANLSSQWLINMDPSAFTIEEAPISKITYANSDGTTIRSKQTDSKLYLGQAVSLKLGELQTNITNGTSSVSGLGALTISNNNSFAYSMYIDNQLKDYYLRCYENTITSTITTSISSTSGSVKLSSALLQLNALSGDTSRKVIIGNGQLANQSLFNSKVIISSDTYTYALSADSRIEALGYDIYVPISQSEFKTDVTSIQTNDLDQIDFVNFYYNKPLINQLNPSLAQSIPEFQQWGVVIYPNNTTIPNRYIMDSDFTYQGVKVKTVDLAKIKDDMLQYLIVQNRTLKQQVIDQQTQINDILSRLQTAGI